MATNAALLELGLGLDSELASPDAPNFRPPSWPPARDWPVILGPKGDVVSRWGDPIWRLDPWAGTPMSLNFGDGTRGRSARIDAANADLLRILAGWWLYGRNSVRTATTLHSRLNQIRPLFVCCSKAGILASELQRYPRVLEQIYSLFTGPQHARFLNILHSCYEQRDLIGYTLIDRNTLTQLEARTVNAPTRQTPYIPPRIWRYQVTRLRECLDDFLAHRIQVEECFEFCLQAYSHNFRSLSVALESPGKSTPFQSPKKKLSGKRSGKRFYGPFALTAEKFGIHNLLLRWISPRPRSTGGATLGIDSFSKYMTLISRAGLAYLANFSLMRIDEAWNLQTDCLKIEHDPSFGAIYTLRGRATKPLNTEYAVWITSPSAKVAVEAMSIVAKLRSACAKVHPRVPPEHIEASDNPFFQTYGYEPWSSGSTPSYQVRRESSSYESIIRLYPKLFDLEILRITPRDIEMARLVTPSLDSNLYAVGKIWKLAWHQLRRTGAVNMQASGLVSDASLQFQLKHVTRAMSLYYGRGFSKVRLEETAETLYVRTLYETLGRELSRLSDSRFVSPHGDKRKYEIVRLIDPADVNKLTALAQQGHVGCREIVLGYCTHREPCPYGGIESVAHCGGGDDVNGKACSDVLYDTEKREQVQSLDSLLDERIHAAPVGSPLRTSLEAQKRSIRNYFNVIDDNG